MDELEKFYLLQALGDGKATNNPPFFVFCDDIPFNKHRKVEAYWRFFYGSFANSIFQFYTSHNYDEETAREEVERLIVDWATNKEEIANFQRLWLPFARTLGDLLGLDFNLITAQSLYWFLIYDPSYKKSGLIWLMAGSHEDKEAEAIELNSEEPLTTGDYLIDLETKLRLAYAEGGFDPSLLDRLCVVNLQKMLKLLAEHQERIAKKYDLDGKGKKDSNLISLNSLISQGQESFEPVAVESIDNNTSERLTQLGVVLPEC